MGHLLLSKMRDNTLRTYKQIHLQRAGAFAPQAVNYSLECRHVEEKLRLGVAEHYRSPYLGHALYQALCMYL